VRCDQLVDVLDGGRGELEQPASLAALIAVECAIFAGGAALVRISTRRRLADRAEGLLLGAAAGALFGVSDVALKYLTQASPGPVLGLVSPWMLTALIAGVIAFYASARSLQFGQGVEVIALTSVAANLAARDPRHGLALATFALLASGTDPDDVPGQVAALQPGDEPGTRVELPAAQAVSG
jgi:hypothetical protein